MLVANILQTRLTLSKGLFLGIAAFLSAGFSKSASIANLTFWTTICLFLLFIQYPQKKPFSSRLVFLPSPRFLASSLNIWHQATWCARAFCLTSLVFSNWQV
jgi:hypothetical protein